MPILLVITLPNSLRVSNIHFIISSDPFFYDNAFISNYAVNYISMINRGHVDVHLVILVFTHL